MKYKLLIGLVVVAVAGGLAWKYWPWRKVESAATGEKAPEFVEVKRGPIRVEVETTGQVVANQEVEIKCKASGEVTKLPLDVSDPVKLGDLLVQLDPVDEERSVKQAEASLAIYKARLEQAQLAVKIAERDLESERARAQAGLRSAQAQGQEAQAKLQRVEQLLAKQMASPEELETARSNQASAQSALASAEARMDDLKTAELSLQNKCQDVKVAQAQVETNELSLSDARQRLADTTVNSPIDGVVATRNVQVGQIIASGVSNVGGGTTVLKLVDLSRVFVLASVDESDIGHITRDLPAVITVDAFPERRFRGKVTRVATNGTLASSVVTFEVKIEVEGEAKHLLKPQMTANIRLVVADKADVLLVPVEALKRRRGEYSAQVKLPDGKLEERTVTVGASDGEMMEVIKGLQEGEKLQLETAGGGSSWRADASDQRKKRREEGMKFSVMGGGTPRGPRR